MINLVRVALRRPYTMAVAAMLIMLMGAISVTRMVVDIFPTIDIPVVYVAWSYNGLNAEDMERRVVLVAERAYSTTVNGIERIESLSIPGQGILKIYFQQGANVGAAIAQISAQSNAVLRIAPPGMQPPNIIQFNASNVPVVQVTLNSKTLAEQLLSDYANQFLRLRLFTIPGLSIPGAFGGKQRQIIVEVDTAKASSKGLSQMDVVNAMGTTNVIVPAGIARLGPNEYNIQLNSSPQDSRPIQLPAGRCPRRHPGAARRPREGQRQLRAADQHRPYQRSARQLPADPQEQYGVDAGGGQCREEHVAGASGDRA